MTTEYAKKLKRLANDVGNVFVKCTFTDTHENTVFRQQLIYLLGYVDALPDAEIIRNEQEI